jgi:hypothetical protein
VLEIEFWSSFHNAAFLKIEKKSDSITIELKASLANNSEKSSVNFERIEKTDVRHGELYDKLSALNLVQQRSLLVPDSILLNSNYAMETNFKYISNGEENFFSFYYLENSNKVEYELLKTIFRTCMQNFKIEKSIEIISRISNDYLIGIQSVILSQKPLEYRLYGNLHIEDGSIDENFINELPTDEIYFLNLEYFNSSRKLAEKFESYEHNNELAQSYWLVTREIKKRMKYYYVEPETVKIITNKRKFERMKAKF